jgi:pyridoxal 5'-phosphate synthase pdxS subunit
MIKKIQETVTIPVMAKVRIGHFAEAQILQSLEVDYIDESEVLTPADDENHIDKNQVRMSIPLYAAHCRHLTIFCFPSSVQYKIPFVCGARNLGEALRRIEEGAAMIRTKGEAGTGNVVEAVRHIRTISRDIKIAQSMDSTELYNYAKKLQVSYSLLKEVAQLGRLPVVNFAAGGLATPADVSLCMQLGVDGVFVGSGIFKSGNPQKRAEAMVQAVTHYKDPEVLAKVSEDLGEAMVGIDIDKIVEKWSDRESVHK